MKKLVKKLVAIGMCGMMLVASVGCSKGKQTVEDANAEGVTEVVFWHSANGATGEALEKVISTYNETRGADKGIKVNLVYQGYEGTDKVLLAYQTKDIKNAPDINQGLTSTIPQMMELDWTVSAADYMAKEGSEITEGSFYEALTRSCSYEDEMVAVPFANSTLLLYYNVDALKEAGFDAPPATMDELVHYTEALTKKDAAGNVARYGLNMQTKRYQLVNFIVSQSEASFFGDNEGGRTAPMTKLTIGEDGTLRAFLEKLDTLVKTGGYKYVEDSINEEFAQGLSAMAIMSSSRVSTIQQLVGDSFEFMTAPIPKVNAADTSGAAVGGSALMMFDRGSEKRVEAAWDVLQYCASPEAQYIFASGTGYIPVNKEAENLADMKAYYEANPQYAVALEQMKNSSPLAQEPFDLVYGEINSIITDAMLEFCEGKLGIDETIEKITSLANKALEEYHYANN
ncbi:MAG: ABC transporter substrate-binding protein [Cellulosilyticaceae bacterium]